MPELSPAQAESHTTPKREKQGGLRSDPSPDIKSTTSPIVIIMTTMSTDYVACTFARPAGTRTDLVVLYVAEGHHLEGEVVICNLAPSQQWIIGLDEGDLVYVRDRLREGRDGDYLGDACANAKQPLFGKYGKEQPQAPIQTFADLEAAYNSEGRDLPGSLRIDTYLSDPEHVAMVEKLTLHCSKKEAGHLLLKYAIKNLPVWTKQSAPSPIYDWLNNF